MTLKRAKKLPVKTAKGLLHNTVTLSHVLPKQASNLDFPSAHPPHQALKSPNVEHQESAWRKPPQSTSEPTTMRLFPVSQEY